MPSDARRKLENRLRDIDDLLRASGTHRGRRWHTQGINRSALVLCTAHLEGFLEDLFREGVGKILEAQLNVANVPRELKLLALRPLVSSLRLSGTAQQREQALRNLVSRAEQFGRPARRLRQQEIDPQLALSSFSNPWRKSIDGLFGDMGIPRVVSRISWPRVSSDILGAKIDALVRKRNDIAHGTVGVNASKTEVRAYRNLLRRFATKIDETVRAHVEEVTGATPW